MRSDVQLVPGPPFERRSIDVVVPGAVAQLGERELCKLEVVGSIPIGSTKARGSFVQRSIAIVRRRTNTIGMRGVGRQSPALASPLISHSEGGISRFAQPVDLEYLDPMIAFHVLGSSPGMGHQC